MVVLDAILLLAVWWDHRRTAPARVDRRVEGSPRLMGTVEVTLRVRGKPGARVRITDDAGPGVERLPPGSEGRSLPDASPLQGATLTLDGHGEGWAGYTLLLRERGDRTLGDLYLRTRGGWGLAWREWRIPGEDRIRVQPGMDDLRRARLSGLRHRLHRAGQRRMRRFGEGSEFESLREYALGDDPRTVDWKASARRTTLLVRNFEAERSQNLVLVLDTGRLMREWFVDRERLDVALAAALLLAERARAFGDRVGLMAFDQEVRLLVAPQPVQLGRIADRLADLRTRPVEPNYPAAFASLRRAFRKRALVVVFSDILDAAASNPLVEAVAGVARHHLPMLVALRNPDVEAWASAPVDHPDAAFRRGAAEELLQARASALRALRRSGAQVVDARHATAVEATLSRYVEIKERGLL